MRDTTLDHLDWTDIGLQLETEGHALLPGLLDAEAARALARQVSDLGCGELMYFDARLPAPLGHWRTRLYHRLRHIANHWNETLGIDYRYPAQLEDFLQRNRKAGQTRPQSHLNRLCLDDHWPLHSRNAGEHVFPLQLIALLSEPGVDFQGGEFVMVEQRPRMQSRPVVVPLELGDAAIIATAERPVRGARGHYRVTLRHAISRVRQGERIGLELSFHDAP
ncbi:MULTISPECIES: 2OG-Fe(II) oxygenase [unclassified Pseudomonas]|uniref:2OG-Fe(II) oxygenase n=1 Tax=unclassified Pseudomonas TaxID=196821 RepID=UPI00244815DF|nr:MULTISPECIES: 2OG-Fe(II) oxygenase [unclassified Pseudomonas]MDH0303302.1 2OG-Fe(II) oxygenase [Pseudomonas sp. GD04091]MDH1985326.1 2OG-Fe(II) oxygenase [Pseudomonas sp. GD03689]